ncbi:hypothetical protein [Devosia sp. SD17-2]|uniref:hypothetical protein n=1 Tax=Devosia sp. SD17-2 TaxID=2976459 RepID=UPI0023D7E5C0|nr:hypothetical protein [Devosia sp. SD17-2]WEJ32826.1 hypothetical protein NYQ88_18420 [Devosia sp. SD17-2]
MDFKLQGVSLVETTYLGRSALEITMPSAATQDPSKEALTDRDYMAWLPTDFGDGTIEVDVASVLAPDAPGYARGFIGLTFRIDAQNRFESIYLRPVNARVEDQIRRNRTVQYVAYPEFPFPRLRKEEPEKYETYVDIALDEWIGLRIEVKGATAKLFVNDAPQPTLIVTDMKLGEAQRGGVGLWIEAGTVGYFSNLRITPPLAG